MRHISVRPRIPRRPNLRLHWTRTKTRASEPEVLTEGISGETRSAYFAVFPFL